jgi:hypothetical protein
MANTANPTVTPVAATNGNPPVTATQGQAALASTTAPTQPAKPASGPAKATNGNTAPGKVFTGANGAKNPVTSQQLFTWLNTVAGGNYSAVQIQLLPNCNPKAASPMPFTNMQKAGKRSNIFWALVKGAPGQGGKLTNNLQAFLLYASSMGASSKNPLDLLAALNGGFSTAAKTYGTPYIKLVFTGNSK